MIDKKAGDERAVIGARMTLAVKVSKVLSRSERDYHRRTASSTMENIKRLAITAPATEEATQYEGWGTALKPAHEPIVMARKPLRKNVVE